MALWDARVIVLGACPTGEHVRVRVDIETPSGVRSAVKLLERTDIRRAVSMDDVERVFDGLLRRFARRGTFTSLADFRTQLEAEVFQL